MGSVSEISGAEEISPMIIAATEKERSLKMKLPIKPEQFLPLILIIIDIAAAVVCLFQDDKKRAIYWLAAAVLNWAVTF